MSEVYLKNLKLVSKENESLYFFNLRRTCYNTFYPFKIFPKKEFEEVEFEPVTIFYGGNGSGKSTLLNIIAEMLNAFRHSAFNKSSFFLDYISMCEITCEKMQNGVHILTSDDVFDFMLNMRYLNDGIDLRREELFKDWYGRKFAHFRLKSLADYDDWVDSCDAQNKSQSKYVKDRLMQNVNLGSNGESAMNYFVNHINENALYLLDEPENSLALPIQKELCKYISDSAKHFGCQFVIATHSPILLSMADAKIYDLDEVPVITKEWTELDNVRQYFDFFEEHRDEFLK